MFLIFTFLLCSLIIYSETSTNSSEIEFKHFLPSNVPDKSSKKLTSFNGIKFGATKEEADAITLEKGWKKDKASYDVWLDSSEGYKGGVYAGLSPKNVYLYFVNNKFYHAEVIFEPDNDEIDVVLEILRKKYNLTRRCYGDEVIYNGCSTRIKPTFRDSVSKNFICVAKSYRINPNAAHPLLREVYYRRVEFYCYELLRELANLRDKESQKEKREKEAQNKKSLENDL